jgi:hypothetical protein
MCLSPAGGNDHLNDPIVQFFCDRDPSRGWYFMVEHDDVVKIKNFSNSLCLTAAGPPNFKPEQYTCDSNMLRLWRFVPIDATTFRLVNVYSNLCLGISGGLSDKNAEAVQTPCDNDPSRIWKVKSRTP